MSGTSRVAVIGAGPAGSAAAMGLLRVPNIEVVHFERYELPRQKVCGSGMSPWTLELMDPMDVGDLVRERAHPVEGARMAGSSGDGVELRGEHETAVLLREELDALLAREAEDRGADLRDDVKVHEIARGADGMVEGVHTDDGDVEVDAVVDGSGANGTFSRADRPGPTLHTLMGWYHGVEDARDLVEIFFDSSVKPHYGWIFPETPERVNIGICCTPGEETGNVRERYQQFLDRRVSDRLDGAERRGRLVGHPVKTSYWATDLVQPGTLAAGEAGHLADMATAEGIYHALLSGWIAGRDVLGPMLAHGVEPTEDNLSHYTWLVRKRLGARLAGGRALMESLKTPAMDALLAFRDFKPTRALLRRGFAGLFHG